MRSFDVPLRQRSIVYSAVAPPTPERHPGCTERSSDAPLRLVSIGALVPHKGHDVLIRALKLMAEPARLFIVGGGAMHCELDKLAEQYGVAERVNIEAFDPKRASDLLLRSDAYVQPSRTEGLGTAVLEAMLVGLPVVASGVGGLVELVGDDHGWAVPPNDPAALAGVLDQLARDLTVKPREIQARVERARRLATTRHSPTQMLQGVRSIYDGLL